MIHIFSMPCGFVITWINWIGHSYIRSFLYQWYGYGPGGLYQVLYVYPARVIWPGGEGMWMHHLGILQELRKLTITVEPLFDTGIILYMHPANERRRYIVTSSVIGWALTQNDLLYMRPANERRRYNVTSSLIGWAHTQNYPCWYV